MVNKTGDLRTKTIVLLSFFVLFHIKQCDCFENTARYVCEKGKLVGSMCFLHFSTPMDYDKALDKCNSNGGTVAHPKHLETIEFLSSLVKTKVDLTIYWVLSSNSSDTTCQTLVYPSDLSRTSSSPCNTPYPYMCTIPACPFYSCKYFQGLWYTLRRGRDPPTYVQAKQKCERNGGQLALLRNITVWRTLKAMAEAPKVRNSSFTNIWVGLTDVREEGIWVHANGDPVDSVEMENMWYENEPNGGTVENCGVMMTDWNYQIGDISCTHTYSFFCQYPPIITPSGLLDLQCRPGYSYFDGWCYKIVNELRAFPDSHDECEQDGSFLATKTRQSFLNVPFLQANLAIKNSQDSVWVGLYFDSGSDAWKYSTRTLANIACLSEPQADKKKYTCGSFAPSGNSCSFIGEQCFSQKGFICQHKACPPHQTGYKESCVQQFSDQLNLEEAENRCERNTGSLTVISNENDKEFIGSILETSNPLPNVWIRYVNQGNSSGPQLQCSAMTGGSESSVLQLQCDQTHGFLCQFPSADVSAKRGFLDFITQLHNVQGKLGILYLKIGTWKYY
ncbi:C-type mannose receptor 2-like [Tachypleus tridentatus]|uniref:C-type mannose receptor 2-like n=1 Tax=Tachypleus tridentatus TaxID=6853 RepID=UPI003FD3CE1A